MGELSRDDFSAAGSTPFKHSTACCCAHASTETMHFLLGAFSWLECSFHEGNYTWDGGKSQEEVFILAWAISSL